MRILLDENLDKDLVAHLPGHEVLHVTHLGWNGIINGKLLKLASENGFQAFVTVDKNLQHQQNVATHPFAFLILDIHPNILENEINCVPAILEILLSCSPGRVYVIEGPHPKRNRS
ncbi:MAG: DUF5615 family PIN-like protein [Armatimonadetes bacterium]|nr:hypothetical protein [Armatimonadota bacterium]MBS1701295.1 DUF5615 family PIN-like protein [Armatimonadota bacterium]MBS1728458.1 DUF5615 family PIN-like protein [Armatimonadota bacterium]